MLSKLTNIILTINISGLSLASLLEAIHPGVVSGAISLSWIWLGSLLLMLAALLPVGQDSNDHDHRSS